MIVNVSLHILKMDLMPLVGVNYLLRYIFIFFKKICILECDDTRCATCSGSSTSCIFACDSGCT